MDDMVIMAETEDLLYFEYIKWHFMQYKYEDKFKEKN